MKTLIELFDEGQINNVVAGLRFNPEKIIYVGFKEVMTNRRQKALNEFFYLRNSKIKFEYEIVGRYDFEAIVERLNFILDTNEDCYFDLTGGKELVLTAMGFVSQKRNIPMFQINIRKGEVINVRNCEDLINTPKTVMSIKECVALNGGALVYEKGFDFSWKLDSMFKADLNSIWEIASSDNVVWNKQSLTLAGFEKYGTISNDLEVSVDLKNIEVANFNVFMDKSIIYKLVKKGLLLHFSGEENKIVFKYKNSRIRQCILKAGNILELYLYMLLNEINDEDPGYYDDIDMGIYIDWDGVIHNCSSLQKDTRNEIDVMVMRDMVPVFISCKNGTVPKEALYELATVAEKFGGGYAKKVLVATHLNIGEESRKYIKQRASDMNISLIICDEYSNKHNFKKALKDIIK